MNKFYTSIEQSKKLAEILPLESADMCWWQIYDTGHTSDYVIKMIPYIFKKDSIPCWSLSTLLNLLPNYQLQTQDNDIGLLCSKDGKFNIVNANNPIDACYEMIIKLHEQNLI